MGLKADTWGERLEAIFQDLHDLAANVQLKIELDGDLDDITGTLWVRNTPLEKWDMVGSVLGAWSPDDALADLVEQFGPDKLKQYKAETQEMDDGREEGSGRDDGGADSVAGARVSARTG
jgi:hypothetical protein